MGASLTPLADATGGTRTATQLPELLTLHIGQQGELTLARGKARLRHLLAQAGDALVDTAQLGGVFRLGISEVAQARPLLQDVAEPAPVFPTQLSLNLRDLRALIRLQRQPPNEIQLAAAAGDGHNGQSRP